MNTIIHQSLGPDCDFSTGSCAACGYNVDARGLPRSLRRNCPSQSTATHPGDELSAMLASYGVKPKDNDGCGCLATAKEMNRLGAAAVLARLDEFADRLREGARAYSWAESLKAGILAAADGLILNPLDPFPALVKEACRRAEAKAPAVIASA